MKLIDGLWWPDSDRVAQKIITSEVEFLDEAIKHCKKHELALQAGGNVGVYPLHLSKYFDWVITFEPEEENFDCLEINVEGSNIIPCHYAIGSFYEELGISRCEENTGAHHINTKGSGISVVEIDSMGLSPDLIQLDIEGFELFALQGAKQTIEKCSPVIMLEDNGLSDRYGSPRGSALKWLESLGYRLVAGNQTDYVMVRNGDNKLH